MRKDTRLSTLFRTASDEKLGGAWERGYLSGYFTYPVTTSPVGSVVGGVVGGVVVGVSPATRVHTEGGGVAVGGARGWMKRTTGAEKTEEHVWVCEGVRGCVYAWFPENKIPFIHCNLTHTLPHIVHKPVLF